MHQRHLDRLHFHAPRCDCRSLYLYMLFSDNGVGERVNNTCVTFYTHLNSKLQLTANRRFRKYSLRTKN